MDELLIAFELQWSSRVIYICFVHYQKNIANREMCHLNKNRLIKWFKYMVLFPSYIFDFLKSNPWDHWDTSALVAWLKTKGYREFAVRASRLCWRKSGWWRWSFDLNCPFISCNSHFFVLFLRACKAICSNDFKKVQHKWNDYYYCWSGFILFIFRPRFLFLDLGCMIHSSKLRRSGPKTENNVVLSPHVSTKCLLASNLTVPFQRPESLC